MVSLLNGLGNFGTGLGAFAGKAIQDEADKADATARQPLINATPAAPVESTPAAATPAAAPGVPANLALMTKAIYGQESGSGANTTTSVTGARGGMQIEPATFQQYAKPGESIDNPAHNLAVGQRIIADLWQKSGGDPARVAVGYFSGPGNIAPPDSPTPWIKNAADPTGKTVSGYVNDIMKRLGTQT